MYNLIIAILSYIIDRIFGEFQSIKHPIIIIGNMIKILEILLYKDTVFRGFVLVAIMLIFGFVFGEMLEYILQLFPSVLSIIITSIIASMFISHNMLKKCVRGVVFAKDKHKKIAMLVSRDTKNLSMSDIYKASIETYGENLSDGVVAPLFYLVLFGLKGIIIYKIINTMDSMIGYKNQRYEKFGKVAARVDDIANFIPARITAILIMLFAKQKNIFAFYKYGKKHDSPNAGHPISAMALSLGIKLGGDTSYFGKVHKKPYFGEKREKITKDDVIKALHIL